MAYEEYDINDIKRPEDTADTRFQKFLLAVLPERQARGIYCVVIDIIALFAKIGIVFSLPFKFVQFWLRGWKKQNDKKTR